MPVHHFKLNGYYFGKIYEYFNQQWTLRYHSAMDNTKASTGESL